MCRKNQLWGCMLMAFGLGVLVGLWLEGGFFCHCFGFAGIIAGACMCRKR